MAVSRRKNVGRSRFLDGASPPDARTPASAGCEARTDADDGRSSEADLPLGSSRSNPVAITVITRSSPMSGLITCPTMMLAWGSAASRMIEAASSTSWRERLGPPVMFNSTPLAPSTLPSSKRGLEMAFCDASTARLVPRETPIPITARPV